MKAGARRWVAALVGLAMDVLLGVRSSAAAVPLYEIVQDGALGWAAASLGDLDGDTVPDFAAGAPGANGPVGLADGAGEIRVFSGASGSPIGALVGLLRGEDGARLGRAVAAVGDLDGDGTPDIAAAAPANDQYCELSGGNPGYVVVFSGADGSVLRRIDGESQAECFGAALAALGDVDGDGAVDLLVGAPGATANAPGSARVHSGADGTEIRRHAGEGPTDNLGVSVTGLRDVDRDGIGDYAVGAPFNGSPEGRGYGGLVIVFSGASGEEIARTMGEPGLRLGTTVAAAGEPEGPGGAHLLAGTRPSAPARDRVVAFRLRRSGLKRALQVVHPTDSFGSHGKVVLGIADLDGDGRGEMVSGGDWGWVLLAGRSALPVLSGEEGNTWEDYGWLARAGDVTGDGIEDLLVGNPIDGRLRLYTLEAVPPSASVNVRLDLDPVGGATGHGRLIVRVRGTKVSVKVKVSGFSPGIYALFLENPDGNDFDILYPRVAANGKGVAGVSQRRFLPDTWGVVSPFELSGRHVSVVGDGPDDVVLEGTIPEIP